MIMNRLILAFLLSTLLFSCDSGNILEMQHTVTESGKVVKLTATVYGVSEWDNKYNIALAGFEDNSLFATMQRTIPENTEDGSSVQIVLSNIPDNINTIELAITNRLRKRILTLVSIDIRNIETGNDTIRMDLGAVNISKTGCMQMGIFDRACIQCHGGNGHSAGNLNLTEGNSPDCLVDVDAQSSVAGMGYKRIVKGNADQSLLYMILNENGENILRYNHTEILSSHFKTNLAETRTLIREWIDNMSGDVKE